MQLEGGYEKMNKTAGMKNYYTPGLKNAKCEACPDLG
jgi:hypothetical protein